jgi:hypothetical protein
MIRSIDRRDSYRLHLDPGQAEVRAKNGPEIQLRDLSAGGVRLIVHDLGSRWLHLPRVEIELAEGGAVCARPEVVRVRSHEPGVYHLGARLRALSPEGVHRLARFIARELQRRTSDPARLLDGSRSLPIATPLYIRNVLARPGDGSARPLWIVDRHQRLECQLGIDGLEFAGGQRVIRAHFLAEAPVAFWPGRAYTFLLGGPAAVTVFESHCLSRDGGRVTLAVPREVRQADSRASRRIELTGAAPVRVSFPHPRLPGPSVEAALCDVAQDGLSFAVPSTDHGLFPGDCLAHLRLCLPEGAVELSGVVRSIRERGRSGTCCGVELVDLGARGDGETWRRFVLGHLHPGLVDGKGRVEQAWSLLDSSRYADLWTPPHGRGHLHDRYLCAWQAPTRAVAHSVLLDREQGAVGMTAASLIAPRTWLLHHLAHDNGDGDSHSPLAQCCELVCGILHRLEAETDLEHFVIIFERDKRWNQRLYGDFAARYFDPQALSLTPMEVFRCATEALMSGPDPDPTGSDVTVVEPTPALLALLAARLSATTPGLERRALALDEERLTMAEFTEGCRRHGYERGRHLSFVAVGGRPRAALVAESGDEGVNIFGLLNTCRLVALTEEDPGAPARAALLRHARHLYQQLGKRHFLFFDEGERDHLPGRLGFARIAGGLRWIAHRDVIPAWLAYLEGLMTAPPRARRLAPLPPLARAQIHQVIRP